MDTNTDTKEAKKFTSLKEALSKDETTLEDEQLLAELMDAEGKLKVDMSLPAAYELEVMAQQLLAHLASYHQSEAAWKAARNTGDNAKAKQLFDQLQYNRLTAAIIQRAYPEAKAMADQIAEVNAGELQKSRKAKQ